MNIKKCEKLIDAAMKRRIEDIAFLLNAERNRALTDLGNYGLSFDYIAPDTHHHQPEAYFCYRISWGRSSDEFRFFVNPDFSCHRVEYWLMHWFDKAHRVCEDDDQSLMQLFWDYLSMSGEVTTAYRMDQPLH